MNTYWAIARHRFHGEEVKKFEAATDDEARAKAKQWYKEDLGGFWEIVAVAKEIPMVETGFARRSRD